jgi:outer membrane protein OmpA-like peptidoglycan-associated protein
MKNFFSSATLLILLTGCASAPVERVVLLPGPDGKLGKLAVTSTAGATVLEQAYGTAAVSTAGKVANSPGDEAIIRRDFARALAALPPRPISHTLFFEHDSDQLIPASEVAAQAILVEVAARPVADIIVIGHTDTVGELGYNDQLSLQRAEAVRARLIQLGGAAERISVAGRGERELAVDTEDDRHEPKNRRAELIVR